MAHDEDLARLRQGVIVWNVWREQNPGRWWINLIGADLGGADLGLADLRGASLIEANLSGANLSGAQLPGASLGKANLSGANLRGANLIGANLIQTDLTNTDLTGCFVYGASTWDLKLEGAKQRDLVITRFGEPAITVDNLEVAQFIHLLLHNEKIRNVIDTITSKVVLILGNFTPERKAVLDALRDELRQRDYLPVLFDFDKPRARTSLETISTLAHMARFVIADITDAKSILQELQEIVPKNPSVPVQPLLIAAQGEPGMFDFFRQFKCLLETYRYDAPEHLITDLGERVIAPAEAKVRELRG
ncbi:pentapeptide repeat-containing protein [Defluviicoccus vanus]|uniref:Pentapeptide repeat-containing protein n=1 Tax=Defluviicoccus vanus TaxID=111831 RepID=A0A7H1N144_9PROT|nr:pentapeptide repeat-containing protein [Defluviicoccus vanus]QNT69430.1 pentapeptide repeat-containing protein [Defluviicoccus vanus]